MKELFEKVYIKSEADLPKEDGTYFAEWKKEGIKCTSFWLPNDKADWSHKWWLENINWYLIPMQ